MLIAQTQNQKPLYRALGKKAIKWREAFSETTESYIGAARDDYEIGHLT
jgi:hypothetical protein